LRNLRASARALENPHGQDLPGVMDLRRRAEGGHLYIREVDNDGNKIVFLHNEQQARLSGRLQYSQEDTTFDVVAPGSARTGVSQAAIDAGAPTDGDWHHFSAV